MVADVPGRRVLESGSPALQPSIAYVVFRLRCGRQSHLRASNGWLPPPSCGLKRR